MTDQELKDLVASLSESGKETERIMRENDRILTEKFAETDRCIQETGLMIKELSKQMGGINDNIGHHAEQYFQDVFRKKLEFGRIKYDEMIPNLAHKDKDGEIEFDIALLNGNSIALIEIKNRIHPKFVKELAENRVKKFREFFPKYKKFQTRLGIASFSFGKKVIEEAEKYGIGLVRQVGDSMEIRTGKLKVY